MWIVLKTSLNHVTPSPLPPPPARRQRRSRASTLSTGPVQWPGRAGPDRPKISATLRNFAAAASPSSVAAGAAAVSPPVHHCCLACAVPAVRGGAEPARQAARAGAAPRKITLGLLIGVQGAGNVFSKTTCQIANDGKSLHCCQCHKLIRLEVAIRLKVAKTDLWLRKRLD
jgi:hypothetical protein